VEVVAGAVAGRPERTEVTVVVDVPLAPGRTTVFDVRGPAVRLENLGRMVGEHKLSRRQGPRDECRRDHVAVGHLNIIQPVHNPIVVMFGSRCKRRCRRPGPIPECFGAAFILDFAPPERLSTERALSMLRWGDLRQPRWCEPTSMQTVQFS
jgi:hypothetical protein